MPPTTTPERTNPPYKGECGQPKIESDGLGIIGGTEAEKGAWPWQVLIQYEDSTTCGGTLIHPEWVVTAARCVYRKEAAPGYFTITTGEHDRSKDEGSEMQIKGDSIYIHPDWDHTTRDNDVALVQLRRPALLGKYIQPACYPSGDLPVGTECYITGWGVTAANAIPDVLQQGKLPIVSSKVCAEKNPDFPILDSMICGGSGGADEVSGCQGDEGGPLVCKVKDKWELHGTVSYVPNSCSSQEAYTVFSRTDRFKEWMKHVIATSD